MVVARGRAVGEMGNVGQYKLPVIRRMGPWNLIYRVATVVNRTVL